MSETGINLTRLRESRGLTQEKVAEAIGSEQTIISRHERTGRVHLKWLQRYAAFYGTTVDKIIGKDEEDEVIGVREHAPAYQTDTPAQLIRGLIEILTLGLEEYERRRKAL